MAADRELAGTLIALKDREVLGQASAGLGQRARESLSNTVR